MAMSPFQVDVVTVANALYTGEAHELHCKGSAGQMVVLAHHQPLITRIEPGTVKIVHNDEAQEFEISGGVLEVANNHATLLCEADERSIPAA